MTVRALWFTYFVETCSQGKRIGYPARDVTNNREEYLAGYQYISSDKGSDYLKLF